MALGNGDFEIKALRIVVNVEGRYSLDGHPGLLGEIVFMTNSHKCMVGGGKDDWQAALDVSVGDVSQLGRSPQVSLFLLSGPSRFARDREHRIKMLCVRVERFLVITNGGEAHSLEGV